MKYFENMKISQQVNSCYEYVDLAERAAYNGAMVDSNRYWRNAFNIASSLLKSNDPGIFSDEEYFSLKQIAKHFEDEEDASEYY